MRIVVGWINNLKAFTADIQDGVNMISVGIQGKFEDHLWEFHSSKLQRTMKSFQ